MGKSLPDERIIEITAWVVVIFFTALILKNLAFLFIPLCVSLLLCYVLGIPLEYLERFKIPGYVRIMLVVICVLVLLFLLGKLVQANVRQFQSQLPGFEEKFWLYARVLLDRLDISPDQAREMIDAVMVNFKQAGLKPVGAMMQKFGDSFFSFLGNVIWVLLFMIFILAERGSMERRLIQAFGKERAAPALESAEKINLAVQHYLGLKTLVSLATGFLVTVILWCFGTPFALLWGVLTFVLNFIPNIGSLVATIPPVAITLFQYGSFSRALGIAVLLTCLQVIVGNIVEPKVMGRGLNLSPLVVLLSLIFWGWMWGMTGMLLSVPLTAAIKISLEQLDSTRSLAILMSADK